MTFDSFILSRHCVTIIITVTLDSVIHLPLTALPDTSIHCNTLAHITEQHDIKYHNTRSTHGKH